MPTTTLVTWNLKGSANPDTSAVADHLLAVGADVVLLQEVQWHQARRIARAVGARSHRWSFKHLALDTWPEGMAVVGVTTTVHARTHALSYAWQPWNWRRRIVQVITTGDRVTLVNVHLTSHDDPTLRQAEASTLLALVAERDGPVVPAGDFNERPGGPVGQAMVAAGFRDGWAESGPAPSVSDAARRVDPWPTNWRGWEPGTTELPTQQLDYVYLSTAVRAAELTLPLPEGAAGLARFSVLSDHLPVTARLDL